jgi:hypothetical protein
MSVHDALQAWQEGEITAADALRLSGAEDVLEMYGMAVQNDVEIKLPLGDEERQAVDQRNALMSSD